MSINDGGNSITQTFGFSPSVEVNPLTGNISCAGAFVNDSSHGYDVSTTGAPIYNLDTNNCTDYAMDIFNQTGNTLPDTNGTWIVGGGSNPGNLGQDIRNLNNTNVTTNSNGGTAPASTNAGGC